MRVVARNWRSRSGQNELDLVADDAGTLVFVEVKARASEEWGAPERAIDSEKHTRMVRAAREYVKRANRDAARVRFDTVSVILSRPPRLEHVRDALPVPWRAGVREPLDGPDRPPAA
jgi:putative endonuclease